MRKLGAALVSSMFLTLTLLHSDLSATPVDLKTTSLPIIFESNLGQAPPSYLFLSHDGDVETLFSAGGVDMLFPGIVTRGSAVHLRLLGARTVVPQGRRQLKAQTNYLLGNDPSRWIQSVPTQAAVTYFGIYPGIDLVFHGMNNRMEHDFRIAPGARPEQIRFSIDGSNGIRVDASGNLEISAAGGKLIFQKPVAYQGSLPGRNHVDSAFVVSPDNSVQFHLGRYDHNRELIIDPVFSFSTYLAGNTADYSAALTTDSSGNVYVTGYTYSVDFPIVNGVQTTLNGSPDAFVSKLDPTGHTLLYSTYLGGSSRNYGNAIALDSKGDIVVSGTSSSNDFPHAGAVPSLTCQGNNDCFFIASLTPDGSKFNYSGLIGGIEGTAVSTGASGSGVLALDGNGNAYLAGVTDDSNFEITPGTLSATVPGYPYNSSFVLKVTTTGALSYSTIIPGTAQPDLSVNLNNVFIPNGISVDANGQVTIAGTAGPGLPATAGVIQPTFPNPITGSSSAGFILQLNAKASAIKYATYITGTDTIGGMVVDASGNHYVAGGTSEPNLPVSSNAYQKTLKAGPNCTCNSGFILKLNGSGTQVLAATYLEGTPTSGNGGTSFGGIGLDSNSSVFVGGNTASPDFPLQNPFTSLWVYGQGDMILAEMKPDLSSLLFGSFLSSTDQVFPASQFSALTVGHSNNLIVTGQTSTTDFPTTAGSFQPVPPSQAYHPFISELNMSAAAPSVCLDSWNVNFGMVPAKKSSSQIVHLTNCGNAVLHIKSIVSSAGTVTAKYSCGTLKVGSICSISLTFTPSDSSLVNGTLTFNDDTVISPQVISFSGQGVAGKLSPSTGSYNFGHLLVNTTGAGNLLFFQNSGNAPLQITSVSVDGDFAITQGFCVGTLQPGNFCDATITFSPSAAGIRSGTLMILSNDPVYPRAGISLNGTGDTVYAAPVVTSLGSPTAQIKNGPITAQVYGANFYPASVIMVNGKAQPTKYFSGGELQATLNSDVSGVIGEIPVSVFTPAPGGGSSVAVPLTRYEAVNVNAAFLTTVPGSTLLYASIPASSAVNPNTVIPINPGTGTLGKPIPVGNDPGLLAASSDGSYLFVVTNQDQTVQRIKRSTQTVDRTFAFPPSNCSFCTKQSASDIKGVPGSPQEVVLAVSGYAGSFGEMALYNDAGLVNSVPSASQSTGFTSSSFAFAGNPLTMYSLPFTTVQNPFFNIITIDSQGLHYTPPSGGNYGGNNTTGAEVVSDGTLLYTSAGEVWSPASQTQVGSFPVTTYNKTSYPNLFNLLVFPIHIFVIGDEPYQANSSSIVLSAYGHNSLALTGALAFPQVGQPIVQTLVRWGGNGFAFIGQVSSSGTPAVFLLTSSLENSITSNPVPKVRSLSPSAAPVGSSIYQITLNGAGFTESSVVQWNGAALATTYVANTVLTAVVPDADLASAGTASVTVTNTPPGGGTSNSSPFSIAPLAPLISFSSSQLTFPAQKVGTSSASKTIAVQNPGTATLTISGIKASGANATSFHETTTCGSTLAPGANCSISVVFKPISTGSLTGTVSFTDNATGSPQTISLSGVGD